MTIAIVMTLVAIAVVVLVWYYSTPQGKEQLARDRARSQAKKIATTDVVAQRNSTAKQQVVEYKNHKTFQEDSAAWIASGWKIMGISDSPQRPGVVRMAMLSPIGAYVIKPKTRVWVVYERE